MDKTDNIVLEVRSLSKVFSGTIALEDVSIKFRFGEVHGIVGKNDAGESTLINILSGIILPSSGKIIIKKNDLEDTIFSIS